MTVDDRDDDALRPSPAVAREIHTANVRVALRDVLLRAPLVVIAIWVWGRFAHWRIETVQFFAVGAAGYFLGTAIQYWVQLRREDPVESVHADRLHRRERELHEQRILGTSLVMTVGLIAAISGVWMFQILTGGLQRSVMVAGLVKPFAKSGQWWRMLTATYLHGNLWHFYGNLAALRALGGTIEVYDRRLRVPLVYLVSALAGSLVSTVLTVNTSVGASGGIMGLCGYLFVLSSRRPSTVPSWTRGWMLAAFTSTALLGAFGFFFIDNFAHAGGALAGLWLGDMLIERSDTSKQTKTPMADRLGWAAAVILVAGAVITVRRLLTP